jgi:hypothetical protein
MTLFEISQAFADSGEFKQTYGNLDCDGFVTLIYRNVLEREPDAGGGVGVLDRTLQCRHVVGEYHAGVRRIR